VTARLHAVLPTGVDDPTRPSGGNVYDRRALSGLAALGWTVVEHEVPGAWPTAGATALARLALALATVPDGSLVLVDGLVATGAASVLPGRTHRCPTVVLLHMPVGPDPGEEAVLRAADAVVTPSAWAHDRVRAWYGLRRLHVVRPGTDPAPPAHGSAGGGTSLLCVAAVHPGKGHDLLFDALAQLGDRAWTLTCVGSLEIDPDYVAGLQSQVYARAWEHRVTFTGPLTGVALSAAYDAADLCVLASRSESYGMVVAEAVARALPVVATDVGGVAEALGQDDHGGRPGLLVSPEDTDGLAWALMRWLDEPDLRAVLAASARVRRLQRRGWDTAAKELAAILDDVWADAATHTSGSGGRTWLGTRL
jgi:glycosyltransferase involved in cell wall biosynthesis